MRRDRPTPALPNVIAIANGKGGVGKTSITANLGFEIARAGWRVLLIDLDTQGNLGLDLGYHPTEWYDFGAALAAAALSRSALTPLQGVRAFDGGTLDVCPGGDELADLAAALDSARRRGQPLDHLAAALAAGPAYDLVLVDCPPHAGSGLVELALNAASYLVIPARLDPGSVEGISALGRHFASVAQTSNPALHLLGVVLFDVAIRATRLQLECRELIDERLEAVAPVFTSTVRSAGLVAFHGRQRGLLASEYQDEVSRQPSYWQLVGARRRGEDVVSPNLRGDARGLAADYGSLAVEVLAAWRRMCDLATDLGRTA